MSAQLQDRAAGSRRAVPAPAAIPVALLGVGTVGGALLARLEAQRFPVRVVAAANSTHVLQRASGLAPSAVGAVLGARVGEATRLSRVARWLPAGGIVVDATASDAVAAWHARWLQAGLAVVTANKAACGAGLARYRRISAQAARYGDSATVGAGLPLLRSLRELRAGGDRIRTVAGVLSGSLAWLLDRYDGTQPFSALVREARALGLTEPDPRTDLSGQDVRRKLLILARSAGVPLAEADVAVTPLLADDDGDDAALDAHVHALWAQAQARGRRLRFVARLDADGARVGPEALAADDPLALGHGCDNRVALWSCRYRTQPLVIQGPGAGAEVTAAALLDDVLRLGAR